MKGLEKQKKEPGNLMPPHPTPQPFLISMLLTCIRAGGGGGGCRERSGQTYLMLVK